MGAAALLPLPLPLPAAWVGTAGASVRRSFQDTMVEPLTTTVVRSIDDVPAVCLEEDLINIFRLSRSDLRMWRKFPDSIPFPPLPALDRQIRVSGCVVAWFLAQNSSEYHRTFRSPLEEFTRAKRGRRRPPWWKFAPPKGERYRVTRLQRERQARGVARVA